MKDVVDNTLIGAVIVVEFLFSCLCSPVDMLSYAMDHPGPATIVLISGDRDFIYALSVLRLRQYRVIVIGSQRTHSSLISLASVYVDWKIDILGKQTPACEILSSANEESKKTVNDVAVGGTLSSPPPLPIESKTQNTINRGRSTSSASDSGICSTSTRPSPNVHLECQRDLASAVPSTGNTISAPTSFLDLAKGGLHDAGNTLICPSNSESCDDSFTTIETPVTMEDDTGDSMVRVDVSGSSPETSSLASHDSQSQKVSVQQPSQLLASDRIDISSTTEDGGTTREVAISQTRRPSFWEQ
jgi:hypothetical protein